MNLISIENLSKSHGEKVLFNNIALSINEGEKIGLIGVNGTGKSTLLKIIAGNESYDSGKIIKGNNISIEYLPQNVDFQENATVLEQIFKGDSMSMKVLREYEMTLLRLQDSPEDNVLQKKLLELSNKMDAFDVWELESKAKSILMKLGITDFNNRISNLSGGQKKRIALAGVLISPCELLILDEPTNHIDNETVDWLESYLNERKGALIMITHDRYFLDRVTNKILELNNGNLYSYSGNYSMFLNAKVEREQLMETQEHKRQSLFKKELAWIKRGAKARTTKQKARIDRFEELKEQKIDVENNKIEISIEGNRLGKKIIEIDNISKKYDNKKLLENFSYIFTRNDKVGIVGPNGSGKSTLLNIIIGKLQADSGNVYIGETVRIGYFSQEYENMNENLRVIEYIREVAEFIKLADGTSISASKMLERFLFSSNLQYTYIYKLSGGEKRRLYLLRVLMSSPNVLILDEPTNDLDIETLNVLEEYINSFNGTVISVSHDRYFLDKIANKLLIFKGNAVIESCIGNYSECEDIIKNSCNKNSDKNKNYKKEITERPVDNKNKTLKFSYNEKREYEEIDKNIEDIENQLNEVNNLIDISNSDYLELQELLEKKKKLENELEYLIERWAYLNELAEKINSQN